MTPFQRKRSASKRKLDTLNFQWPIFEGAADWLSRQDILTPERLNAIKFGALADANAATKEYSKGLGDGLSRELQESFRLGEGSAAWQVRADAFTDLAAHQAEAISRTYTHRAQQAGLDEVMKDEAVGELFPYLVYYATQDTRTRATHRAMDGKVAHKDSPLAAEMRELHSQFNCRCTLSPATREDAEAQGIDDDTGWTEPAKDDA
jgi:SPP1 gp7 family putative phage head morphogenesis protein